jgi:hypothetical protein
LNKPSSITSFWGSPGWSQGIKILFCSMSLHDSSKSLIIWMNLFRVQNMNQNFPTLTWRISVIIFMQKPKWLCWRRYDHYGFMSKKRISIPLKEIPGKYENECLPESLIPSTFKGVTSLFDDVNKLKLNFHYSTCYLHIRKSS